jgi:hypothetical protein
MVMIVDMDEAILEVVKEIAKGLVGQRTKQAASLQSMRPVSTATQP